MRQRRPALRRVLLDESFVQALLATDASQHAPAAELYRELVDRYQMGLDRLYALSGVLGDLPTEFRRNALAPVVTLRVAGQHRGAAARMDAGFSPSVAISLVMMRRERIRTVATAVHDYDVLDVEVLGVADAGAELPAADVSSGTEPPPVPQSTDG